MRARNVATVAALAALLSGCANGSTVADGGPDEPPRTSTPTAAPTSEPAADSPALPDGWRWESYRDLELAVPADWSYSGGGITSWCADTGRDKRLPGVGRPGAVLGIACPQAEPGEPDPGSLIRNGGTYVNFVSADENLRDEGDRIVLRRGDLAVVIQAPKELRDQIAATVHTNTGTDAAGCSLEHPLGEDRRWRPPAVAVTSLSDVERVAACKYSLPRGGVPDEGEGGEGPDLISSLVIEGSAAQDSITEVAGAPVGGGPNSPQNCSEDSSYGDEAIALFATRTSGEVVTIVLRYDGCVAGGFDDGTEVRTLTRNAVTPFIAGPNRPNSFQSNKGKILSPKR
ncbi:MAG: hypothetical protein ACT4P1_15335 [Sporichthyaceae bacterium]